MGRTKVNLSDVVTAFVADKPAKRVFGNYRIENNFLMYQAQSSENAPMWHSAEEFKEAKTTIKAKIKELDAKLVDENGKTVLLESLTHNSPSYGLKIQFPEFNTIAVKVPKTVAGLDSDFIFVNSETLDLVGRTMSYGREDRNSGVTDIQVQLRGMGFPMLSLSEFLDVDWTSFKLIELGKTRKLKTTISIGGPRWNRERVETEQNLNSACLFEVGGKRYLAGIDSREADSGKILPYFRSVSKIADSIASACTYLKPIEVLDAENAGLEVRRSGDVFFIPVDAPKLETLSVEDKLLILGEASTYSLDFNVLKYLTGQAIKRGSNRAEKLLEKVPRPITIPQGSAKIGIVQDGNTYVIGEVAMGQRTGLKLGTWHKVVFNG
jgi:hypothetical protein